MKRALKRKEQPLYYIEIVEDCDGFYQYPVYVGKNFKAAVARYSYAFEKMKEHFFRDIDIENEHFRCPSSPESINYGDCYCSYANDDNCCWMSINFYKIKSGVFLPNVNRFIIEDDYKAETPNAKY